MKRTQQDELAAFSAGEAQRAFTALGCHPAKEGDLPGYRFRVWAPKARKISVVGDFNKWDPNQLPLQQVAGGIWEGFSPHAKELDAYKYYIVQESGQIAYKTDPFATAYTKLPDTSSLVYSLKQFHWHDQAYFRRNRHKKNLQRPINIYELHLGSWRRKQNGEGYTYEELASELIPYVKKMGYTHVEFLPITEHPYGPSWGYQVTGYFAPTARYGNPNGLKTLIDQCHQSGIGVILDWVPSHFPKDAHGLYEFDGSCQYEPSDPLMNEHPDWTTRVFDYSKPEVQSFLISSGVFWLEEYHFDGLRVDAVASMLYLDYNRKHYTPNKFGGRENLDAITFLKKLNRAAFAVRKSVLMIAEESTTFPLVTKPDYDGGLGFLFKWNMGWMNDSFRYLALNPIERNSYHHYLNFPMTYAYSENFILPLSHDEVVHGKKSMIDKMPGTYDEKFSSLRMFYGYQMAHPGKKLNFMGNEFAQFLEWREDRELDWFLLDYERHHQMQAFVRDLNFFYLKMRPLWENDENWDGFQWIHPDDASHNVLSFLRWDRNGNGILVLCNFCPLCWQNYLVGLPRYGTYCLLLSSDEKEYGGLGFAEKRVRSQIQKERGFEQSGYFCLPPLSTLYYTVPKQTAPMQSSEKEKNCEISEKTLCSDVIGRRSGKSVACTDADHCKTGGPIWRQVSNR